MLWYNTITLIMNISACFCSAAQIPLTCYPQTLEDAFECPSLCSICFGMSSTSFGHDFPLSLSLSPSIHPVSPHSSVIFPCHSKEDFFHRPRRVRGCSRKSFFHRREKRRTLVRAKDNIYGRKSGNGRKWEHIFLLLLSLSPPCSVALLM